MKMNPLASERARKGTLLMPEPILERQKTRRTLTTEALAEKGASLAEIDWRLLYWLLRHPLQPAPGLGVGGASGASRGKVHRQPREPEEKSLVDGLPPRTPRM